MDPVLPVFISIEENEQVNELREYLKSIGGTLSEEEPENLNSNLVQILDACSECVKSCNELEMEGFMNSMLSLVFVVTEKRDELIKKLLTTLVDMTAQQHAAVRIRVLIELFSGLAPTDPVRYDVYCGQIQLASKTGLMENITTDLEKIKTWLVQWDDIEKSRKLYRLLYTAFVTNKQSDKATKVMLELLGTYAEDIDSQAKDDAFDCIKSFIDRPDAWVMDQLLTLGPVKSLKGELMYQLLEIFISGNLNDYMQFYEGNSNFIESSGLDHEKNMTKMRILTFLSLVHKHSEMTFEELSKQVNVNIDDVEEFVINVLKTRLVRVRIDEVGGKIIMSSAAHRTFDKLQWETLRGKLLDWQTNLKTVRKQLGDVNHV